MAMASKGTVLIIGAGPRIGAFVAQEFAQNGCKVAMVGRSLKSGISEEGYLQIQADLLDLDSVPIVFQTVEKELGLPNFIVYNGALRLLTHPEDPLGAPLSDIHRACKVGFDSAYIAAQEAMRVFRKLPQSTPKAFIYTGNTLNQIALPGVMPFAISKCSASTLVGYAAHAYGHQGYRFYYADQRHPDGRPVGEDVDGTGHAKMYWELANEEGRTKWLVTFSRDGTRHEFPGVDWEGRRRWE